MAKPSQLDKAIDVFELQRAEHLRHAEIMGTIIAELRGQRAAKPAKPRKQKASPASAKLDTLVDDWRARTKRGTNEEEKA